MPTAFILRGGVLLIALSVEVVFRISNRFAKETKEIFRWIYIGGCGLLCLFFLWKGWKNIKAVENIGNVGWILVMMLIISLALTLLINYKQKIK